MARVNPIDEAAHPELASLIADVKGQRGRVSALYGTLLNSPPIAAGWLHFLTAVRRESSLPGQYRELVILRVALLNHAPYEFNAHRGPALEAGVSDAQMTALTHWADSPLFSAEERAVLAYTDVMTKEVVVPESIYEPLKAIFSARELVELTATVAAYNLVSRFLVALDVGH